MLTIMCINNVLLGIDGFCLSTASSSTMGGEVIQGHKYTLISGGSPQGSPRKTYELGTGVSPLNPAYRSISSIVKVLDGLYRCISRM